VGAVEEPIVVGAAGPKAPGPAAAAAAKDLSVVEVVDLPWAERLGPLAQVRACADASWRWSPGNGRAMEGPRAIGG